MTFLDESGTEISGDVGNDFVLNMGTNRQQNLTVNEDTTSTGSPTMRTNMVLNLPAVSLYDISQTTWVLRSPDTSGLVRSFTVFYTINKGAELEAWAFNYARDAQTETSLDQVQNAIRYAREFIINYYKNIVMGFDVPEGEALVWAEDYVRNPPGNGGGNGAAGLAVVGALIGIILLFSGG